MDRAQAGFIFTNLIYDGETIPLGGGNNRPDVISALSNSGSNPFIILRKLDAGATAELEGEYTLLSGYRWY